MKQAFKRIYDVPVIGYVLRIAIGFAKLPIYLRAHEESLHGLQRWIAQADATMTHVSSRQDVADSAMRSVEAIGVEATRLAGEAHRQATIVTHAHESTAERVYRCEATIGRLQVGLDQHLPVVLGFISSTAATIREFQREQSSQLRASAAMLEHLRDLDARMKEASEAIAELRSASAATEGPVREQADPNLSTAIDELRDHVAYLLQRVEFVRRETLFELRYGKSPSQTLPGKIEPRVVNEAKVAQASREGLRINIGSGHIPVEGYVNVDVRELPGVDVVAEAGQMPFDPGSIAELHSAHLMEHFPREQLRREILPYWKSLLRPAGVFRAVVPDAATMIEKYKGGELSWDDLREVTFGSQDYAGDFHYDMFTPESLKALLEEAGFEDVSFPVTGRPNGRCYEMEVTARA